jgi:hypothetical protein
VSFAFFGGFTILIQISRAAANELKSSRERTQRTHRKLPFSGLAFFVSFAFFGGFTILIQISRAAANELKGAAKEPKDRIEKGPEREKGGIFRPSLLCVLCVLWRLHHSNPDFQSGRERTEQEPRKNPKIA